MTPKVPDTNTMTVFQSTDLPPVPQHDADFLWSLKEEPHFSRRKEILKKYPEIQKLFGYEPCTKFILMGVVALQLMTAAFFGRFDSYQSPWFWLAAFVIGKFFFGCFIVVLLLYYISIY